MLHSISPRTHRAYQPRDHSQKRPLRTPSQHGALGYGRSGEQRSLF
nr:MAG TPA: hypothetical protein [Caudoviricetes sp.]